MTRRRWSVVFLVAVAALAGFSASIRFGSVHLGTSEVVQALLGGGSDVQRRLVWGFRLPRTFLAFLVGGSLAISGAVLQALLRNPLAEPYILGISGGAAAGAVLALATGAAALGSGFLPGAAFAGSLLAILLVFQVASGVNRRLDVRVLLLAGVVVGAFFSAMVALVLTFAPVRTVRSALLWMMGSLAGAGWTEVAVLSFYGLPSALVLMALARPLNAISVGEETARYVGTPVETTKKIAFGVASLLTATSVAVAGVIGFVGLIVPHAVRLGVGADQRWVIPLSFLAGGGFLALADVVARTALAPSEIPIGVVTALTGVPLFLVLLRRSLPR